MVHPQARPARGSALIVAGIGCRRGCSATDIAAAVREAEHRAGQAAQALAAPAFKRDEAGLRAAAAVLGLPLHFIETEALATAQATCVTRSAVALAATGVASVAEGAALAAAGGRLLLPRIAVGGATCAIAAPHSRTVPWP